MAEEMELECLFSGEVRETRRGSYYIELPDREVELGTIEPGDTYRIGVIEMPGDSAETTDGERPGPPTQKNSEQPVEEGTTETVEIDRLGDQGDGIATLEGGFVVFVPGVEVGDRVTVRIEKVEETFAFATVLDRLT